MYILLNNVYTHIIISTKEVMFWFISFVKLGISNHLCDTCSFPTLCNDVLSTSWKGEGSIRISSISIGLSISSSSHAMICSRNKKKVNRGGASWLQFRAALMTAKNPQLILKCFITVRGKYQDLCE